MRDIQNVEGRVNLDLWGMDTCVGCRIVEYLLSTVFLLCIGPRSGTSGQGRVNLDPSTLVLFVDYHN